MKIAYINFLTFFTGGLINKEIFIDRWYKKKLKEMN